MNASKRVCPLLLFLSLCMVAIGLPGCAAMPQGMRLDRSFAPPAPLAPVEAPTAEPTRRETAPANPTDDHDHRPSLWRKKLRSKYA